MIQDKDLKKTRGVRYEKHQWTLEEVRQTIRKTAEKYGLTLSCSAGQLRIGGIIGGETVDCLLLSHPEHPRDYLRTVALV